MRSRLQRLHPPKQQPESSAAVKKPGNRPASVAGSKVKRPLLSPSRHAKPKRPASTGAKSAPASGGAKPKVVKGKRPVSTGGKAKTQPGKKTNSTCLYRRGLEASLLQRTRRTRKSNSRLNQLRMVRWGRRPRKLWRR